MKEVERKFQFILLMLAVLFSSITVLQSAVNEGPQQSKTGPVPPEAVQQRDAIVSILGVPPVAPVIIPGVPDYSWRHGCGPTAVGMVVGYYDGLGYDDLIPGDASTQTAVVDQAIASGGDSANPNPAGSEQHYEDYSRPEDPEPNPLQDDDYITKGRIPHPDDCIGDYQDTSKSTRHNKYGWSWDSDLGPSFVDYVNQQNSSYAPSFTRYRPGIGVMTWNILINEIDNGRPMIFLVDTDENGHTDHFVTVVGYDIATHQYGCHDTWGAPVIRWENFASLGVGVPWGIWAGWSFQLAPVGQKWKQPPDETENGIDIRCDRSDGITRVLADDFKCTKTAPIIKVIFWGSWKNDIKGQIANIHLSIHEDLPVGDPVNPYSYSIPGDEKWSKDFGPAEFIETVHSTHEPEWCWDPAIGQPPIQWCDYTLWKYEISIDPNVAFTQQGDPCNPVIYWLDIHVKLQPDDRMPEFGWKTTPIQYHWNDDAVWSKDDGATWNELRYPPGHPYYPESIDLSFEILTEPPSEPNNVKWSQPPIPTVPDNHYYGWNEISEYNGNQIVADDWPCENDDPITDIHWWGSYKGWTGQDPPVAPSSFHITIWNDVPDPDPTDPNTFSHPNEVVWEIDCNNFQSKFVGWDYDPRTKCYETCFYFEQYLNPSEYFYQKSEPIGTDTNIYWISIAAVYPTGSIVTHPWGWKARPRIFNDDAVRIHIPTEPHIGDQYVEGKPVFWPEQNFSWDMAFELTAQTVSTYNKWEQSPDPCLSGIHCHDFIDTQGNYSWITIADDWQCQGGVVNDLHWYGNYELDALGQEIRGSGIRNFYLSIHDPDPTVACLPTQNEIVGFNVPFTALTEIYTGFMNSEKSRIYLYEYDLPTPFTQELGQNYWLDITAFSVDPIIPARWRWQESKRDIRANITLCPAAKRTVGPLLGPWQTIVWPLYDPVRYSDMAFAVTSAGAEEMYVKWSQVPEPYKPQAYEGWNELSVYNWEQIAADDWVCKTDSPVTDIHWWGSYLGWSCEGEPPVVPESFHIAIWTDVPAGADPDPSVWFSHPGVVIWETDCSNFTREFVGWDIDPRYPDAPPEACYKYTQDLLEKDWFDQDPCDNIYWLSIAAKYPTGVDVEYAWGWKTRRRDPQSPAPDDAVIIWSPTAPILGSVYNSGDPIWWPTIDDSWDLAFELTTKERPPKEPMPHLKWSQPPIEIDPDSRIPVYSGWDEPSFKEPQFPIWRLVADDFRCLGTMPITSIHWWGSYYGLVEPGMPPPELPIAWKIGFWSNVPAAPAEWNPGDPNKMHYPQLPDHNGWDVDITIPNMSADDWECTKSGFVTDIHFWYSWLDDQVGTIENIKVRIYDNVPATDPTNPYGYSVPGTVLWTKDFPMGQFTTRFWGSGVQGFVTPGTTPLSNNHKNIYQCNIVNIPHPLHYQEKGKIYWLAISIDIEDHVNTKIGWKTSRSPQFMDDAVYQQAAAAQWAEWIDPITGDSLDLAFVITGGVPYSHPDMLLWQFEVPADKVDVEEVGRDFYHGYYPDDIAYQYTLHLEPDDFFWQNDYIDQTQDNIFWLSIGAIYDPCLPTFPMFPWGWKTRPWSWMDDAVMFWQDGPLEPGIVLDPEVIVPIEDPIYLESFDVAFELDTDPNWIKWEQPFTGIRHWPHYEDEESMATEVTTTEVVTKWFQQPDVSNMGIDVDATDSNQIVPPMYRPQLLADDFNCISNEAITGINIYGSWWRDRLPLDAAGMQDARQVEFTLSIHEDLPVGDPHNPNPWSMPGDMLWSEDFGAGDFIVWPVSSTAMESYYIPCAPEYYSQDHLQVYKYFFSPTDPFVQKGSLDNQVIYWLDVQARPLTQNPETRFGWKTSIDHWNDDAVWIDEVETYNGPWNELLYPPEHEYAGESIDLAFELKAERVESDLNISRLVADDWKCKRETPVTAAVWWGSYIGYQYKPCHGQFMPLPVKPNYFWLTIWTDVPANADATIPFSHPNEIIWEYKAKDYDEVLVGYDKHPHAGSGISVAICGAPSIQTWNNDVQAKLMATGQFNTVDIIDVHNFTPTLAQLQSYNAVLVYSDNTYADSNALGNVMADYVDSGGGVVCAMFEIAYGSGPNPHPLCQMRGRWLAQGYYVIPRTAQYGPPQATLGTVYNPAHPIMQGVSSFDGGAYSARPTPNTVIPPGATRIADWSDRSPLVVTKTIAGVKRADLGLYPPSSDSRSDFWVSSTDGALLMANALSWVASNQPISRRREPVFRYSVRLPRKDWFFQEDVNNIYWFSVVAVYKDPISMINYPWGWTNHKHVFNDDAVAGYLDPVVGMWTWEELYDQTENTEDMSFILFTDPNPILCTCWDPLECAGQPSGDATCNGWVNLGDLMALKAAWGQTVPWTSPFCCADFNQDGAVNLGDLMALKAGWGTGPHVPSTNKQSCP